MPIKFSHCLKVGAGSGFLALFAVGWGVAVSLGWIARKLSDKDDKEHLNSPRKGMMDERD